MRIRKRAVSPVIATVLLIAIVVVIALIVFLWLRNLTKEAAEKFNENVELVCQKVSFSADYFNSGEVISLSNDGNIAIKDFLVKKITTGEASTIKLSIEDSKFTGLPTGQVRDVSFPISETEGYKTLRVIPILLANSNKGQVEFICDDQYGVEISL